MTTTKLQELQEKIASILPKLSCSPASVLYLQDEVLALKLSKHILHISLPWWVFQDGVSESEDNFVVTAPDVDSGMDEDTLQQANERAQRVQPGPNAVVEMVELLGKMIVAMDSALASGEEEDDDSYFLSDDAGADGDEFSGFGDGDSDEETAVVKTRRQGLLHKRAEAAAHACSDARACSDFGYDGGEASSSTRLEDVESDSSSVLRCCRVESRPRDLSVWLEFDLGSLIAEKRAAVRLGFIMDSPLRIKLSYDDSKWGSQIRPPMPDSIAVSQVSGTQGQTRYGPQTMLRDMVQLYYQDHQGSGRKRKQGDMAREPSDNEFLDLMLVIGERLRKLTWSCVICNKPFDLPSLRIRPCSEQFCLFKFEEVGLGCGILHQLREASQVAQVELTFAAAAAHSRHDVFEPYPSFLLLKKEIRDRAGVFTPEPGTVAEQQATAAEATAGRPLLPQQLLLRGTPPVLPSNKQLTALACVLENLPKISDMVKSENEKDLVALINGHLIQEARRMERVHMGYSFQASDEVLQRGYEVVRFVLSSNQLHLREVQKKDWLPIPNTLAQIAVLSNSPDRELAFLKKMQLAPSSPSSFAFHGSALENWYSIMRNGLRSLSNTSYMRAGAAFGSGLYLSTYLATSMGYAGAGKGWGDFNGHSVSACAIVEIAPIPFVNGNNTAGGILVVAKENEPAVVIRYILLFEGGRGIYSNTISGTKMGALDLKEHFANQRALYEADERAEMERELEAARKEQSRRPASDSNKIVHKAPEMDSDMAVLQMKDSFTTAGGICIQPTANATSTILREYRKLMKLQSSTGSDSSLPGGSFTVEIIEEANIYRWRVTLQPSLFSETLQAELRTHAKKKRGTSLLYIMQASAAGSSATGSPVVMEMIFSGEFPFKPPFLRVISPIFVFRTGHVTSGGSVCMELLTDSGWSAAYSLESMLVQVISAISEGEGHIDMDRVHDSYSEREARESFLRVARQHQWKV